MSESCVAVATGRVDTLMRIPPHGGNINGSEPRVTEEKTNATSGISTVTARESVAQQTIPQIKEQQAGKSQRRRYFIIKNTKKTSLL